SAERHGRRTERPDHGGHARGLPGVQRRRFDRRKYGGLSPTLARVPCVAESLRIPPFLFAAEAGCSHHASTEFIPEGRALQWDPPGGFEALSVLHLCPYSWWSTSWPGTEPVPGLADFQGPEIEHPAHKEAVPNP